MYPLLLPMWPVTGTLGQSTDYFKSTDETRGFRDEYTARAKNQVREGGTVPAVQADREGAKRLNALFSAFFFLSDSSWLDLSLLQDSHLDYISTGLDRLKHIAEDMAQVRPLLHRIFSEHCCVASSAMCW